MFLIDFASSDYFEHRGPIIPLPKGFSCQSSSFDMVVVDAFVYLFKHVVDVFLSYAFEEGCGKAPFVKGSSQKNESE